MIQLKYDKIFNLTIAHVALMVFLIFTIFFVMVLPVSLQKVLYRLSMTGILVAAFFCIKYSYRRRMRWFFLVTILALTLFYLTDNFVLNVISKSLIICLYISIAILLVKQAASSATVNRVVLLESVNGYLMLAMFFAIIITLLVLVDPLAYNVQSHVKEAGDIFFNFDQHLYYGFSSFTAVASADITPVSSAAKSVAMSMGFTGQMYLTFIIAMLVGKYSGDPGKNEIGINESSKNKDNS